MAKPDDDGLIECTQCERRLPGNIEYFFRQRGNYYPQCKECKGSEFGVSKPNVVFDAKDGCKYCARCLKELPADREHFYTDKSESQNLTVACKKCWNGTEYGIHKPNSGREDGLWECTSCNEVYERTTENFYTQGDRLSVHCKKCHTQKRNDARRENRHGEGASISAEKWQMIKAEYEAECAYCGASADTLHRDHVFPVSKGGNGTVANVVPACPSCNYAKSDKRVSDWYPKQDFYDETKMKRILNGAVTLYNE